jgi:hypothetical protein
MQDYGVEVHHNFTHEHADKQKEEDQKHSEKGTAVETRDEE